MARTRKSIQPLNLYKYDVLIEDRGPRSDYFKITQFDGYFYGGRNAFLIAGTSVLKPNSKILVEILNVNGETVYSAPISNFIEGSSRLVQIEVYSDTPIGPGKIVVLGSTDTYLDGTSIPDQWKDKYNVRWITDVIISPLINNRTPIRFLNTPNISVEEKFYLSPSSSFFSQSVTQPIDVELVPKFFNVYPNGYLIKAINGTKYSSDFLEQGRLTGSIQFNGPNGPESASIDIPLTKIYNDSVAESNGILLVTDKQTTITEITISSSGQYTTQMQPYGLLGITSSVQLQYNKLLTFDVTKSISDAIVTEPASVISYAQIRLTNLSTISGDIYKTRISYTSATTPGNYIVLADTPTQVTELFVVDSGSKAIETGKFNKIAIDDYWYASTMSIVETDVNPTVPNYYLTSSLITNANKLPVKINNTYLIDSVNATPEIVSGKYINDVSYFIGNTTTNTLSLFPRSEYTLAFDALATVTSGSIDWAGPTPSIEVYLVPTPDSTKILGTESRGQLIGKVTPTKNFRSQNFDRIEFNFVPKIITPGDFGIRFIVYGGFWNIANISVKAAIEPFFSPDEVTVLLPNDFKYDDLLVFKAEYLDINNNSIGIETTSLPTYFTGSLALTLRDGVVVRSNDLEINGLPIYQTLLQDNFTGLISGGFITTSSVYSQAYTISAGTGFYIDSESDPVLPVYKYVTWPQFTVTASAFPTSGALADWPRTQIAIQPVDEEPTIPVFGLFTGKAVNGTVIEQVDPFTVEDYRRYIVLGRIAHVNSRSIQRTLSLPLTTFSRQYHWFDFAYSLGVINLNGNNYSAGGTNRTIQKTAGQTYRIGSNYKNDPSFPDITTDSATNPTTFAYRYRSGSSFVEQPTTTEITGSLYDDGSGTLQNVNNNQWTIQRIYFFGATATTRIQYGQAVYNSLLDAEAAITNEVFVADPNLEQDASLRTLLILRGGATNLSNLSQAKFISVTSGIGGASGGGGATTLEALSDVSADDRANNDVLVYNSTTNEWQNQPQAPTASALLGGLTNYIPLWKTDTAQSSSVIYQSAGNIGIGTTSPSYALDIVGEIAIRGAEGVDDARMYFQASDNSNRFTIETDLDASTANDLFGIRSVATDNILVLKGNGNVGIGTINPSTKLQIQGNVSASSYTSSLSNQIGFVGTASFAVSASRAISASWSPGITSIVAGSGLSGGTITSTGTISLDTSSVHFLDGVKKELNTEGVISSSGQVSYTGLSNIPVGILSSSTQINALTGVSASFATSASRATTSSFAISSSWAPSTGGTVTSIVAGSGLSGGTITSTGTITLDTSSVHFLDGVKKELNTEGVISSSTQQVVSTYTNGTDNRVLTSTGTAGINGESNLNFDGTLLRVNGQISITGSTGITHGIVMNRSGWSSLFRVGAVASSGDEFWITNNWNPQTNTADTVEPGYITLAPKNELRTVINGTQITTLNSTGLGIGTTSPNRPLHVVGNATITGSLVLSSSAPTELQVIGNTELTGSLSITGSMYVRPIIEHVVGTASAPPTTLNYNVLDGAILFHSGSATANWTLNFRGNASTTLNSIMPLSSSLTVTLLTRTGATAHSSSAYQIDGASITPRWQGGVSGSGNANSIDAHTFTIIKISSIPTYLLLGSITRYT